MNILLHTSREPQPCPPPLQERATEWYGQPLVSPFRYSFAIEGEQLVFRAACAAPALLHPDASEGAFQENLWKYDTAEFFIAREDLSAYLECNVSPNGAWWAAVFTSPRVPIGGDVVTPQLIATGESTESGWSCEARLELAALRELGMDLESCRVGACAILQSPEQVFVTTNADCSGEPDFHRPQGWGKFEIVGMDS